MKLASTGGVINPNENLWHELKDYLQENYSMGLQHFGPQFDQSKCLEYIGNLKEVILKVIEDGRGPTGY